jgi:NAD-dependent SIR2 family protein deacetylase
MSIFRCHLCNEVFDLEKQHPITEVNYCVPCGDYLLEKLKPKIIKHDIWASENKPNPKQKETKKKAKSNGK